MTNLESKYTLSKPIGPRYDRVKVYLETSLKRTMDARRFFRYIGAPSPGLVNGVIVDYIHSRPVRAMLYGQMRILIVAAAIGIAAHFTTKQSRTFPRLK